MTTHDCMRTAALLTCCGRERHSEQQCYVVVCAEWRREESGWWWRLIAHGIVLLSGRRRALRHVAHSEGERESRRDPLTGQPQTRRQKRMNTNKQQHTNGTQINGVILVTRSASMKQCLNYLTWDGQ